MKLFLPTLALLSLVTTANFAADGKVYPGSMGIRWDASDPFPALNGSMIQNPSTTKWLRLDLPVIKDSIGASFKNGWVRAVDRHYTLNVRSQLVSIYRTCGSFSGWSSPFRYTSGTSTCAQALTFGAVGANSICHSYFSTHIPPKYSGNMSGVVSYYVEEN